MRFPPALSTPVNPRPSNRRSPLTLNLVLNLNPPSASPGSWAVSRPFLNRPFSMNLPFVAAGVPPAVKGGVSPPGIPGSWSVGMAPPPTRLPMNFSASPSPQPSPEGEGVAYHPRRLGPASPRKPSPSIPASPRPHPSKPAGRILPLPAAGEGRGEGRSRSSSLPGFMARAQVNFEQGASHKPPRVLASMSGGFSAALQDAKPSPCRRDTPYASG